MINNTKDLEEERGACSYRALIIHVNHKILFQGWIWLTKIYTVSAAMITKLFNGDTNSKSIIKSTCNNTLNTKELGKQDERNRYGN